MLDRCARSMAIVWMLVFCAGLATAPRPVHGAASRAPRGSRVLAGRVLDGRQEPLADVEVVLVDLGIDARTGADGTFSIAGLPDGPLRVMFRRAGYASATREVEPGVATPPLDVSLALRPYTSEPITVTATREPRPALDSPLPTASLAGPALAREGSISLSHALESLPGVRTVSTGGQIGKPMIRGLVGARVLVLDDGHRMEDYSWSDEDGPSIDPLLVARVEVIRGPASVLYGSDALGGVANALAPEVPRANPGEGLARFRTSAYFGSNSHEVGVLAAYEGARNRLGWRLAGAGRFAEALHTPHGELENTGFGAFTGDAAIGWHGEGKGLMVRYARYGGEFKLLEAGGPPPGQQEGEEEGPERKASDDRVQLDGGFAAGGIRFETKLQWQRHSLIELSDEALPAGGGSPGRAAAPEKTELEAFDLLLNTGTLDILAHHRIGGMLHGTAGLSGLLQSNDSRGPIPLVPDASAASAGAFVYEEARFGRLSVLAGLRGDSRSLSVDANETLGIEDDDRDYAELAGDVGFVLRPRPWLALAINAGRAWRAPTLFELYANGPQVAEARYLVGRSDLGPERAFNLDGGVRWQSAEHQGEVSVYRNRIEEFIVLEPTPEQIGDLRVWDFVQADAVLSGLEAEEQSHVAGPFWLSGRVDLVRGENEGTDDPLPLIPAARGALGAEASFEHLSWADRFQAGIEVEMVGRKDRLAENEEATGGYTLLHGNVGLERSILGRDLSLLLRVRNAANKSYRDFLSRYKEFADNPGRDVLLKVSAPF